MRCEFSLKNFESMTAGIRGMEKLEGPCSSFCELCEAQKGCSRDLRILFEIEMFHERAGHTTTKQCLRRMDEL